eukprot:2338010-Pyramimonas_sp.AAC.1
MCGIPLTKICTCHTYHNRGLAWRRARVGWRSVAMVAESAPAGTAHHAAAGHAATLSAAAPTNERAAWRAALTLAPAPGPCVSANYDT